MLTTSQAAAILGISQRRVRQLIEAGRLKSVQHGKLHMINPKSLGMLKVYRKPGRPRKEQRTV